MNIKIEVENIRCSGCANTITKKLTSIEGVKTVDIAIEEQIVTIETETELARSTFVEPLLAMGYPEKGSVEGMNALKGKARSVISCAIGKVS
jgi:copper chaperone